MRSENIEFIALFEASGWKREEAVRRLKVDRASISRYLTGKMAPGAPVLELFKFILASEKPGALTAAHQCQETALADWERKVVEDLRWLHKQDRERVLNALRAFIEGLPRREPVNYRKVSSDAGKSAGKIIRKLSSAVDDRSDGEAAPPPTPKVEPLLSTLPESTSQRPAKHHPPKHSS